ncbi:MAG: lytic transglycosylase domain-containing protein [Bacteroidota bacterium]
MKPRSSTLTLVIGVLCLYFITLSTTAVGFNQPSNILQLDPNSSEQQTFLIDGNASEKAKHYIHLYTKRYPHYTAKMLQKAQSYFPTFSYYLEKEGLPEALKFLPLVESNLNEKIFSPTGAAGLWQFMPATARHYGLQVDEEKDERLDVHKSSEAAALLLKELYQQFGDWKLSLAAYNSGAGRVRRAIRKAGSKDFEQVKAYLPKQTQLYTDKLFAMIYVGHYHQAFNFDLSSEEKPFTNIDIKGIYNIEQLCQEAKVTPYVLFQLNPHLNGLDYLDARYGLEILLPNNQQVEIKKQSSTDYFDNSLALKKQQQKAFSRIHLSTLLNDDLFCINCPNQNQPRGILLENDSVWAITEKTVFI